MVARRHDRWTPARLGPESIEMSVVVSRGTIQIRSLPYHYKAEVSFTHLTEHLTAESIHRLVAPALEKALKADEALRHHLRDKQRRFIIKRDGHICYYCQRAGRPNGRDPDDKAWHVDHKEPKAAGGLDDEANLVLSCASCNLRKNDSDYTEWLKAVRGNPA